MAPFPSLVATDRFDRACAMAIHDEALRQIWRRLRTRLGGWRPIAAYCMHEGTRIVYAPLTGRWGEYDSGGYLRLGEAIRSDNAATKAGVLVHASIHCAWALHSVGGNDPHTPGPEHGAGGIAVLAS